MGRNVNARIKRCERALHEVDCTLLKSHARNWSFEDQRGYMIVDYRINALVAGSRFDLTLEDVEDYCGLSE